MRIAAAFIALCLVGCASVPESNSHDRAVDFSVWSVSKK